METEKLNQLYRTWVAGDERAGFGEQADFLAHWESLTSDVRYH